MNIKIESLKNGSRVTLSGEVTIYSAAKLKEQLLDVIHASRTLEIDLSNVSEFDSAGLQLLALAKREADALDRPIHFSSHSESVQEVLNLYDLNEIFDTTAVN